MADPDTELAVRPETFLSHWRQIRDSKDDAADSAAAVARAKKAAKKSGVDLDVVKWLEHLATMESDERSTFLVKLETYSKWIDLPLGAFSAGIEIQQPKAAAREDFTRWQAGQDGHKAGVEGVPREGNPHRGGSAEHVEWDKRWSVGFKIAQKKLATAMAKKAGQGAAASRTTGKMAAAGEGLASQLN